MHSITWFAIVSCFQSGWWIVQSLVSAWRSAMREVDVTLGGRLFHARAAATGNQLMTVPSNPNDVLRRCSSVEWSTVSKAADRSSNISTARSPLSIACRMSPSTLSAAVSVEGALCMLTAARAAARTPSDVQWVAGPLDWCYDLRRYVNVWSMVFLLILWYSV